METQEALVALAFGAGPNPVFLVTALCGDYYCGCGIGHLLGVYSTPEAANEAAAVAKEEAHVDRHGHSWREWQDVEIQAVALDARHKQKY